MPLSDAKLGALVFLVVVCLAYGLRASRETRQRARLVPSADITTLRDESAPVLLLFDVARRSGSSPRGG